MVVEVGPHFVLVVALRAPRALEHEDVGDGEDDRDGGHAGQRPVQEVVPLELELIWKNQTNGLVKSHKTFLCSVCLFFLNKLQLKLMLMSH